jgi:succinoglycan biosynthesis protein ExoA
MTTSRNTSPTQPWPALAGLAVPVSVVMPVRNEERYLRDSVRNVLRQDYPGEIELVIAVGPSRDRTAQIASQLAAADQRIKVVDNPSGGIATGINVALSTSRHPVIARVDGHSLLPAGYIRTAVATLRETGADNVGGIMAAEGVTPFQQAVAWAMTSPFGVGTARFHTGGAPGPADTVYLGVFRREAIDRAGGYDEKFEVAEDWELNHRIRKAGGLVWFQPALRVTYRPRATAAELGMQYFRYGRWRRAVARQHAGTINLRYTAPPAAAVAVTAGAVAGVAGLIGRAAGAAGVWPTVATAGLALPVLYGVGIAAISARAARELPIRVAARLPLALATMHMSWGCGFLTSPRSLVPDRAGMRSG